MNINKDDYLIEKPDKTKITYQEFLKLSKEEQNKISEYLLAKSFYNTQQQIANKYKKDFEDFIKFYTDHNNEYK